MIHSEYERCGSTVQPYTRSDGTFVRGYERQGSWVQSPWYKRKVHETTLNLQAPGAPLLFASKCKFCSGPIFVHRSKEKGCVVYDSLQKPWHIHRCWEHHTHYVLKGVAETLSHLDFNGSDYRRDTRFLKRLKTTKIKAVTGFVFGQSNTLKFPSIKNTKTSRFRVLLFIPSEKPDRYMEVLIPVIYDDDFEEQTAHTLEISYLKHHGKWRCFVEGATRIIPGSNTAEERKSILKISSRCVWCGNGDVLSGKWGFDTENRVECEECAYHRLRSTSDEFREQIKNWYKTLRKVRIR